MTNLILVGVGGFFGAIARFSLSDWINKKFSSVFPYGTLTVNLIGSFVLGLLFGGDTAELWYLLLGTGFMGAFTTFSTINIESIELYDQHEKTSLVAYLGLSYIGGISLAFLGLIIGMS